MTIPSDMQGCTYNGQEVLTLQVNGQTVWEQKSGIDSAAFGDILFYDVQNDCLITRSNDDYDINEMPLTDYEPIGVCVWDKASHAAGKTVFMSVKLMTPYYPQNGSVSTFAGNNTKSAGMFYGFKKYDLSQDIPNIRSTSYVDTAAINDAMMQLVTYNWWSENTLVRNENVGYAPAWEACWRFSPPGTTPSSGGNRGDWLLPTVYDMQKFSDNYQDILDVLTAISNKAGDTVLNSNAIKVSLKLATEKDETYHWDIYSTDGSIDYYTKHGTQYCRAVYIV